MRFLFLIPIAILVAGAGVFLRARKRRHDDVSLTSEPVSSEWLAQARGRDEQHW
jgi:cytochrome c-type biogenesis protein CcmH/NrfF